MVPPWDHILGEMGTLSLLAQLSLGWGALLRLPSWVAPISCGTICLPACHAHPRGSGGRDPWSAMRGSRATQAASMLNEPELPRASLIPSPSVSHLV